MAHKIIVEGDSVVVSVDGRLDANAAPLLEKDLIKLIKEASDLTFDLARLDYVSSAGLRVLLVAYKRVSKEGAMRIVGAHDDVLEMLVATGFAEIFGCQQEDA